MKSLSRQIFYQKTGFVTCSYDDELQAIVQEFETFPFWNVELIAAYKAMHEACLQAVIRHKAQKWLCLSSKMNRATPQEVQEYITHVVTPKLINAGLKYYAQVLPGSALSRLSTKQWQHEAQAEAAQKGVVTNFTTAEEAITWLQQQK